MVTEHAYPFTSSSSLNATKHTTHWKEFPALGISTTTEPVSLACRTSLQQIFLLRGSNNKTTATTNELAVLRIATEASSHPSGILALQAQPWVYAGGGLGNEPECLALPSFHTCLAGAATAAAPSLTFARLCWPAECTAHDLVAEDLVPLLLNLNNQNSEATKAWTKMNVDALLSSTTITSAQKDYATQIIHMLRINRFLQTGWTCGYWQPEWNHIKTAYGGVVTLLIGLVLWASSSRRWRRQRKSSNQSSTEVSSSLLDSSSFQHGFTFSFHSFPWQLPSSVSNNDDDDDDTDDNEQLQPQDNKEERQPLIVPPSKWSHYNRSNTANTSLLDYSSTSTTTHTIATTTTTTTSNSSATSNSVDGDSEDEEQQQQQQHEPLSSSASSTTSSTILRQEEEPESQQEEVFQWYHAFCWRTNLNKLCTRPPCRQTASLDGLRVLSLLWIVLGHVMAIASSTLIGPGYSNPVDVLPPQGWTTTLSGQVVFSSRLAVDTFFVLSGFLLVHVLVIRQSASSTPSSRQQQGQQQRYENDWSSSSSWSLPFVLATRLARLLPLYTFTLAFYMLLAPHLNGGPFWHQWRGLLEPCYQKNGWLANLLFVNNLWTETSVTETCFYHSWYLAVDIQLFVGSTLLLWIFRQKTRQNRIRLSLITALLFGLSVCWTAYGSWVRKWSINTFDGAAVARYDVEAYAHPLTRAQAYLAGMFVALQQSPRLRETTSLQRQSFYCCYAHCCLRVVTMALALAVMTFVSFVTVTGAYAQRPCQYQEWPGPGECGSTWSPLTTFLYTAFSRTLWILAVSIVMFLCLTGDGWVASLLSWQGWVPLSHLSFGVYLIHPIVIFVWQLGGRDKTVFRLVTFGMNYVSVCVASYVVALVAALLVELPCAVLWKHYVAGPAMGKRAAAPVTRQQSFFRQQKDTRSVYGATTNYLESGVETR